MYIACLWLKQYDIHWESFERGSRDPWTLTAIHTIHVIWIAIISTYPTHCLAYVISVSPSYFDILHVFHKLYCMLSMFVSCLNFLHIPFIVFRFFFFYTVNNKYVNLNCLLFFYYRSRELTPKVKCSMDSFSCTTNDYLDWMLKTTENECSFYDKRLV